MDRYYILLGNSMTVFVKVSSNHVLFPPPPPTRYFCPPFYILPNICYLSVITLALDVSDLNPNANASALKSCN